MSDTPSTPDTVASPVNLFGWPKAWADAMAQATLRGAGLQLAPGQLSQPINPGWSFGNIVVNTVNSSAPATEQAVLAKHSYGRQIGRLVEAVEALAQALPKAQGDARVQALLELAHEVHEIKQAHRDDRLDHLRRELDALKARDPQAWQALLARR